MMERRLASHQGSANTLGGGPVVAKRSMVQRCHLLVVQLVDTSPGLQQYLQARLTVGTNCCVMEGSQAVAICHVNVSSHQGSPNTLGGGPPRESAHGCGGREAQHGAEVSSESFGGPTVDTSPGLQQYLQARLTVGTNCCVMEGSQAVAICHVNVSVVLQQ